MLNRKDVSKGPIIKVARPPERLLTDSVATWHLLEFSTWKGTYVFLPWAKPQALQCGFSSLPGYFVSAELRDSILGQQAQQRVLELAELSSTGPAPPLFPLLAPRHSFLYPFFTLEFLS